MIACARQGLLIACIAFVAGCGASPPVKWTLDTSNWPDCGWSDATMVYTNLGEVRHHDLTTRQDSVVWSESALEQISGISPPEPTWISLSSDRRWMAVTLQPSSGSPQQLALSCDGATWARLGPDDARYVGGG